MKLTLKLFDRIDLGENIWVFAITGGPGAGKSSVLAFLLEMFLGRPDFVAYFLPEIASQRIKEGLIPGKTIGWIEFQKRVLLDTLSQEQTYFALAKEARDKGKKVIIICDRGAMDGEAYIEPVDFTTVINSFGMNAAQLCDQRYHAVIHMVTAADGAEEFYTLENNTARSESPEEAREIDKRTLRAWQRHSHPRVIDNSTGFKEKIRRVYAEVCAVIGDPVPSEFEDKFLIAPIDPRSIPVPYKVFEIIQDYIMSPVENEVHRVRMRSSEDGCNFFHTIKSNFSHGKCTEREKIISEDEYEKFLSVRMPKWHTVRKCRASFFYERQFFEVDIFQEPCNGLYLMEAEKSHEDQKYVKPPFICIKQDVTGDPRYSNASIARNGKVLCN